MGADGDVGWCNPRCISGSLQHILMGREGRLGMVDVLHMGKPKWTDLRRSWDPTHTELEYKALMEWVVLFLRTFLDGGNPGHEGWPQRCIPL